MNCNTIIDGLILGLVVVCVVFLITGFIVKNATSDLTDD